MLGNCVWGWKCWEILDGVVVVGYFGCFVLEKNLVFFVEGVVCLLKWEKNVWLLVVGEGFLCDEIEKIMIGYGVGMWVCFVGKFIGKELNDVYVVMDVFVFLL